MNRRKVLAGLGSTALAASAGCTGILGGGGGGGGCSVPDKDVGELMPSGGDGFEKGQTMSMPTEGQQNIEGMATGSYSKGGSQYSVSILELSDKSAAKKRSNNVGQTGQSQGKAVYVQTGKHIFVVGSRSGGKTGEMKTLLKKTALSDSCVSSNSKTYEG